MIEDSPLGLRLARGAFWSLVGTLISRGLFLLSSIIVARLLGKEVFGELGIIHSTVVMFQVFAGLSLGTTTAKHVAELRKKDPQKVGRIIGLSGLVAVIVGAILAITMVMLATWLASKILAAPHLASFLRLSCILLFFGAIDGAQIGVLSGLEAFKAIAHVNLAVGILSFFLMVGGAYWGGLMGCVLGLIISMSVNCILNSIILRKQAYRAGIPILLTDCYLEWPILLRFSLPAVLGGLMVGPVNWICRIILVNQPQGYAEMGIFNAANQWSTAILFLPNTLGAIVLPILSSLYGSNDNKLYHKVLLFNVLFNGGVALSAATIVTMASSFIMFSYGTDFVSGIPVLVVLSFASVLIAINNVIGQSIASSGRMWHGLLFNAIWAIVFIVTACIFVSRYGALGLAVATIIAYTLHTLLQSLYVKRVIC